MCSTAGKTNPQQLLWRKFWISASLAGPGVGKADEWKASRNGMNNGPRCLLAEVVLNDRILKTRLPATPGCAFR